MGMNTSEDYRFKQTRSFLRKPGFWLGVFTVASFIVAVVGLTVFLLDRPGKPNVIVETVGETNVLDLHRPLKDLNIIFRDEDITERNLNLKIITINVANIGNADILQSHYDQFRDWGIRFTTGKVIEVRLIDASSKYLRDSAIPDTRSEDSIVFPKVILENDEFFVVEALVLHSKDEAPSFHSIGKIAGVGEIAVLTRPVIIEERGLLGIGFQGSVLVQIVRLLSYGFGFLLTIAFVAVSMVGIIELRSWQRRRQRRQRSTRTHTLSRLSDSRIRTSMTAIYEQYDVAGLKRVQYVIENLDKLQWNESNEMWGFDDIGLFNVFPDETSELESLWGPMNLFAIIKLMSSNGLLKKDNNGHAFVDPIISNMIDDLVDELTQSEIGT